MPLARRRQRLSEPVVRLRPRLVQRDAPHRVRHSLVGPAQRQVRRGAVAAQRLVVRGARERLRVEARGVRKARRRERVVAELLAGRHGVAHELRGQVRHRDAHLPLDRGEHVRGELGGGGGDARGGDTRVGCVGDGDVRASHRVHTRGSERASQRRRGDVTASDRGDRASKRSDGRPRARGRTRVGSRTRGACTCQTRRCVPRVEAELSRAARCDARDACSSRSRSFSSRKGVSFPSSGRPGAVAFFAESAIHVGQR